jgi:hypothetical protein
MARKSKAIADFQAKYKVAEDELWEVHGSTWCVKHKALERIAAEVGIVWEKPELKVCDMAAGQSRSSLAESLAITSSIHSARPARRTTRTRTRSQWLRSGRKIE